MEVDTYNQWGLQCLSNSIYTTDNIKALIIFTAVSFIVMFLYYVYFDNTLGTGKPIGFIFTLCLALFGAAVGMVLFIILVYVWSIIVFYVLPVILFFYVLYNMKRITDFIKNSSKKQKHIDVSDIEQDLKCEQIAQQAYDNLKKDFPDIKYEDVLKRCIEKYK
jgi:energy-coupling factor transporter transmembrane protein EcfT